MRDLKRVKEYVDLGVELDKAIEMVDAEMENETQQDPIVKPEVDLSGYVKKEDVDQQIKGAIEEERRKSAEVDPPEEDDTTIESLMGKFF